MRHCAPANWQEITLRTEIYIVSTSVTGYRWACMQSFWTGSGAQKHNVCQ